MVAISSQVVIGHIVALHKQNLTISQKCTLAVSLLNCYELGHKALHVNYNLVYFEIVVNCTKKLSQYLELFSLLVPVPLMYRCIFLRSFSAYGYKARCICGQSRALQEDTTCQPCSMATGRRLESADMLQTGQPYVYVGTRQNNSWPCTR